MTDPICDNCVYAEWFDDKSVGIWPYVDGCKHSVAIKYFESREDFKCSFFIERHEPECEKVRCYKCGSPNTTTRNYNGDDDTIVIKCLDCNAEKTVLIFDLPFGSR